MRDAAGSEVDYVLDGGRQCIPIEVKWTDKPTKFDIKHIKKLLLEYSVLKSYVVCRAPWRYKIDDNVIALNITMNQD